MLLAAAICCILRRCRSFSAATTAAAASLILTTRLEVALCNVSNEKEPQRIPTRLTYGHSLPTIHAGGL